MEASGNTLTDVERITLGRMQNPVRGLIHGAAAVATLIGLGILVARAWGSASALAGSLAFGGALLFMYVVSSLYHSVPWSRRWKRRLQRIDHSAIYLVVAGTFTPIAVASLDGVRLALALGVVWLIAAIGIALKALMEEVNTYLSVTLQMIMGWTAVFWIPHAQASLGDEGVGLIALGGACYLLGVVVFVTKRPRLAPRAFSSHELFHLLVVAGSSIHFLAILRYAIPAAL